MRRPGGDQGRAGVPGETSAGRCAAFQGRPRLSDDTDSPTDHHHRTTVVTGLVLARPADTWAHRGIDFVPPADDEIEAVLAHMSVERRNPV